MLTNYHTHCNMCGHAGGTIEEYVVEAIKKGFVELGMSDHLPYEGDIYGSRMSYEDKDRYLDEISRVKSKYENKIKVYSGFEAEYLPSFHKYYEQLLNDSRCDYLLLGVHFYENKNGVVEYVHNIKDTAKYVDYAMAAVEAMKTGYFKYICHPDYIGVGNVDIGDDHRKAFDLLIEGSIKYNVPLEYNANGLRRGITPLGTTVRYQYPVDKLWTMARNSETKVIVGCDAHSPELLYDEYMQEALQFVAKGKYNVIDKLMD